MAKPKEAKSKEGRGAGTKVTLRCWGVRGSIPTPGPDTSWFGGNTSCVEIRAGDRRLIFDAGTGIRLLGANLNGSGARRKAHILLTHFHWDHIQGFPFFAPLYDPQFELDIIGPEQEDLDIRTLFAGQMGPVYFPIPFSAVAAGTSFTHLNDGGWADDGFEVASFRMRHASYTLGYRIKAEGRTICYLPDNELEGGEYPVGGPKWRKGLEEFVGGSDLLIHDAMYTEDEYRARHGWGHSTFGQTFDLAKAAGVKRLLFFHHAPERTDDELARIVDSFSEREGEEGAPSVEAAREGVELMVGER